mmetsp:Transcript_6099/g.15083  ORF Transcript_6099/g.15083 Transcript_6099/m.15083 type:complete len:289 (+) Transcript_6099:1041-1907(+)
MYACAGFGRAVFGRGGAGSEACALGRIELPRAYTPGRTPARTLRRRHDFASSRDGEGSGCGGGAAGLHRGREGLRGGGDVVKHRPSRAAGGDPDQGGAHETGHRVREKVPQGRPHRKRRLRVAGVRRACFSSGPRHAPVAGRLRGGGSWRPARFGRGTQPAPGGHEVAPAIERSGAVRKPEDGRELLAAAAGDRGNEVRSALLAGIRQISAAGGGKGGGGGIRRAPSGEAVYWKWRWNNDLLLFVYKRCFRRRRRCWVLVRGGGPCRHVGGEQLHGGNHDDVGSKCKY